MKKARDEAQKISRKEKKKSRCKGIFFPELSHVPFENTRTICCLRLTYIT